MYSGCSSSCEKIFWTWSHTAIPLGRKSFNMEKFLEIYWLLSYLLHLEHGQTWSKGCEVRVIPVVLWVDFIQSTPGTKSIVTATSGFWRCTYELLAVVEGLSSRVLYFNVASFALNRFLFNFTNIVTLLSVRYCQSTACTLHYLLFLEWEYVKINSDGF